MDSIVTVGTAAPSQDLTSLADIKAELDLTDSVTTRDAWLTTSISRVSETMARYCRRVFIRQSYSEQWRLSRSLRGPLVLSQWPCAVTSISLDGTVLGAGTWEEDAGSGRVWRLNNDNRVLWGPAKIVAVYDAGYDAPGTSSPSTPLPDDIQGACIEAVKAKYFARMRDPLLKSEAIPNVIDRSFWVSAPGVAADPLPPDVLASLAPYRRFDR